MPVEETISVPSSDPKRVEKKEEEDPVAKKNGVKPTDKDDNKAEELVCVIYIPDILPLTISRQSEEDQQLSNELEMLAERLSVRVALEQILQDAVYSRKTRHAGTGHDLVSSSTRDFANFDSDIHLFHDLGA